MKKTKISLFLPILLLAGCSSARVAGPVAIQRRYSEGEVMKYNLALNGTESGEPDFSSLSRAVMTVKKNAANSFYESIQWTSTSKNGADIPLAPESRDFRQLVSLDPAFKLTIPDLSKVIPLIEPITDTLTFYADLQLAIRKSMRLETGQRLYVSHGIPNSWAGGTVLVGRDCIDFEIAVANVDPATDSALLRVRHLPPPAGCGEPPAPWMKEPVSDTPNNWYQVVKTGEAEYTAGAAKETFDDEIKISLKDGRILSATQINPLTGTTRICKDAALTDCGKPEKFTITRHLLFSPDND